MQGPNISKVASDLIQAYQELQRQNVVSPRYEKTALYFPQSPIEEQIEEENEIDSPREEDYLQEISELRRIVDRMRLKYMNIPQRYLQPLQQNNHPPKKKVVITKYQSDFLRQQYGKLK